jgi:hypothetical protein
MKKLYNLFIKCDATQVEINPFVETTDGRGLRDKNFSYSWKFCRLMPKLTLMTTPLSDNKKSLL